MEFKDFDKLSNAGKMEAMRAGNSLVIALENMAEFIADMAPFLENETEHLNIQRIGILNNSIKVFSVSVVPVLKFRAAE